MEKQKEKQSVFEKVKKTGVKKVSRLVVSIFFVFALVFATITNLTFSTFDFKKWLANTLILCGIIIFGMVIGESSAIDNYRQLERGVYMTNVKEYNAFIQYLRPYINNFDYWYSEQLPKELETKQVNFLVKNGLKVKTAKNIVKYCKKKDIDSLIHEEATKVHDYETDKDIYIEKIEAYQEQAVTWVLDGHITLHSPNANYFTVLFSDDLSDDALSEQGNTLSHTRKRIKNINRGVRISSSIVVSALLGALTVSELMSGDDVGAWMNLISRITAFLTSILSGYMSGKILVNYDARIIKNKYEVLLRYHNDIINSDFVVRDDQEILKKKYEESEKKKEEHKKNVIDPTKDNDKVEIINQEPKQLENKSNQIYNIDKRHT